MAPQQQLKLVLNSPTSFRIASMGPPASERMQRAREILTDLLCCDGFDDEQMLPGKVSEGLSAVVLELDSLAGMQKLYELWVG